MKNYFAPTIIIVSLATIILFLLIPRSPNISAPANNATSPEIENTNLISTVDTSTWNRVQLHQNISILIPPLWSEGTDGIYNYDNTQVTGPRDPNFPNNSFKCMFYTDESLRSKIIIESEMTLNTNPKVTLIKGKWNNNNDDSLRKLGEKINIYTFKDAIVEKYIECNVFKGVMIEADRIKLENSILTVK